MGFGLCFLYLRNVKQLGWNHKRVYRIYRQVELNLRIKPRKRLVGGYEDLIRNDIREQEMREVGSDGFVKMSFTE